MSAVDRLLTVVTILLLWILALGAVGVALHTGEVLTSEYSPALTVSLMVLGGVLYLLSSAFVTYFGGTELRLF